jgi:sulfur-oxidizing protein SoxY
MSAPSDRTKFDRRQLLLAGTAGLFAFAVPLRAMERPTLAAAIRSFTGKAPVAEGRVKFEIAPLVENGNAVPVKVEVDSPMTAEAHVRRIALLTEKNPQPDVAVFHLGPRAGRAQVSTRIRLATSQVVVALAELSDGTFAISRANIVVTIAACIEDLSRA